MPNKKPSKFQGKRLAVTVSGAVSLGSYEAGVMYEVTEAISRHNAAVEEDGALTPQEKVKQQIKIDVVTGASAGGMTVAIGAQAMLFNPASFAGVYDNPFYLPWVKEVDIKNLLKMGASENKGHSLLSSDFIETLAARFIKDAPGQSGTPAKRHSAAHEAISLGLALSNLNGIDYGVTVQTGKQFIYSRYQDEFQAVYGEGFENNWSALRAAAVSCGAFPFAFRVKELTRSALDYPEEKNAHARPPYRYVYTDGGVFQNEPLGLAKDLVDAIDEHRDIENRFYLFVAPGAREGTTVPEDPEKNPPIDRLNATLGKTAGTLLAAIYNQARFHEWIMAEKVNGQIKLLNERGYHLAMGIKNKTIDITQLQLLADRLLTLFKTAEDLKTEDRNRLREQFLILDDPTPPGVKVPIHDILTTDEEQSAWLDAMLVFEWAANLAKRDEMTIYTITAKPDELAGDLFFSFGGFFDYELRRYDYEMGRKKARTWLIAMQKQQTTGYHLGPLRLDLPPLPDPSLKLDGKVISKPGDIQMKDLPKSGRVDLKEAILSRVGPLVDELLNKPWYGFFARNAARMIIKGMLNNKLGL